MNGLIQILNTTSSVTKCLKFPDPSFNTPHLIDNIYFLQYLCRLSRARAIFLKENLKKNSMNTKFSTIT
jgi:hypothetical protein